MGLLRLRQMGKSAKKDIVILGSTGSIGVNTLEVVRAMPDRFGVVGLCAGSRWERLAEQIREFRPRVAVLADREYQGQLTEAVADVPTELKWGEAAVIELAGAPDADAVVSAIAGGAGLPAAVRALENGRRLALANKESLVMGGGLIMTLAAERGGRVVPVDSEHSAIFHALHSGNRSDVERIVITASGGPFYGIDEEELRGITPDEALDHPTWQMGAKVSIDSATMMNKALEIVEARWLFGLGPDRIDVVIHPQCIVHSMVEFADGAVMAQMAVPDMKLPIQYALTYPDHVPGPVEKLDLPSAGPLEFRRASVEEFPALELGYRVAATGGTGGAVLSAADEAAVEAFMEGRIEFTDIVRCVTAVLDRHVPVEEPTLEQILEAAAWAGEEAEKWLA